MTDWTGELIERGLGAIDSLLEQNGLSYQQIALCLPTGGMVNMPAIRDGLNERFGARAERLDNGDRIISEGAAWIAHDDLRLGLAKPIELLESDDTYAPVVPIPFVLPQENQRIPAAYAIYHCVDPRPGRASFQFARPRRPQARDTRTERLAYATLYLEIDEMAPPLMERLELRLAIDHDYVAHVDLRSTMRKRRLEAEIFDLEFTLTLPTADHQALKSKQKGADGDRPIPEVTSNAQSAKISGARLRSNVAAEQSWRKVPGDLVIEYLPNWFDEGGREYSDWQKDEWVYYKNCPYCHRSRYEFKTQGCNDHKCLWKRAYPKVGKGQTQTWGVSQR
jgi:hypothetical protein